MSFGFLKVRDIERILYNLSSSGKRGKKQSKELGDRINVMDSKIDLLDQRVDALELRIDALEP